MARGGGGEVRHSRRCCWFTEEMERTSRIVNHLHMQLLHMVRCCLVCSMSSSLVWGAPGPGGATWSTAGYGVRISVASHVVPGAIEVAHVQRGDQNLATLLLTPVVPLGVTASQLLFSQGCLCPTRDFCCRRVAPCVLMLASPGICVGSAIPTACPASRQPARVLPHCSLGV
jgi:hypothetical protein